MKLTGKRCQCMACGQYFNRDSTFDKHRVGPMSERRCLTLEEMRTKGWQHNTAGFWITAPRELPKQWEAA